MDEGGKSIFKKNMGWFDRTVRFLEGVALIPTGLFLLGGWQGRLAGIVVAILALGPIVVSVAGFCPGYILFGISTLTRIRYSTELS